MMEHVAVIHIRDRIISIVFKLHDHSYIFHWHYHHHIFLSLLIRRWCASIFIEDKKLDIVNMKRMSDQRLVIEFPNLSSILISDNIDAIHAELHSVDCE